MDQGTSFSDWLRRRRKGLDLTQQDLAHLVDYSRSAIRRIEAGELRPSKELARRLIEALGIPEEQQSQFLRLARGDREQGTLDPFSSGDSSVPTLTAVPRMDGRARGRMAFATAWAEGQAMTLDEAIACALKE
jgi:transcriptional regulator with XRE-family HTH domain